jgi:hypothetical protein
VEELAAWVAEHDGSELPDPATGYSPLAESFARVAQRMQAHPGRASAEIIGRTVLDEPIWAFHVQDDGPAELSVLVFAGIHALEWISSETAFQLLEDLLVAPPRGARVTVVPILNVDGRLRVEGDLRLGQNVYRRGNAASPPVDLNRDFATHHDPTSFWRRLLPGYYSSSPAALSQPETRAIDALAARERYDRAASLHAFGGYFYVPWAGRWSRADDYPEMFALGRCMEAAQGKYAYRTRQLSRWGFFFRAQGAEIDHLYERYGTHAFLVELTRSGLDPLHLRRSVRTYFRWYNPTRPAAHVERGVAALKALVSAGDRIDERASGLPARSRTCRACESVRATERPR